MVDIPTINPFISKLQNVQYLCYSNYKMVPIVNTKWKIYPNNMLNFPTPKWSISTLQNGSYPTTKWSIPLLYPNYQMLNISIIQTTKWSFSYYKMVGILTTLWSLSKLEIGRYPNCKMVAILTTLWWVS